MPHLDEELALGLKVLRRHTLETSLKTILKACMEADGTRDPKRVVEIMGQIGTEVELVAGTDGDMSEIVEMLESPEGRKMMEDATAQQLFGMKMAAWGLVDSVCRWTDDATFHAQMKEVGHDVTPEAIRARFEERVDEWMKLDRPELMFAARAHHALHRLNDVPVSKIQDMDYTSVVAIFLDGRPR